LAKSTQYGARVMDWMRQPIHVRAEDPQDTDRSAARLDIRKERFLR
jgi:hypothetical protein